MVKRMREKSEIRIVKHKGGVAHVLFWEGRARPWQITVCPDGWEGGKSRMVSLKTEEAVKDRLERSAEWTQQRVIERTRNCK